MQKDNNIECFSDIFEFITKYDYNHATKLIENAVKEFSTSIDQLHPIYRIVSVCQIIEEIAFINGVTPMELAADVYESIKRVNPYIGWIDGD